MVQPNAPGDSLSPVQLGVHAQGRGPARRAAGRETGRPDRARRAVHRADGPDPPLGDQGRPGRRRPGPDLHRHHRSASAARPPGPALEDSRLGRHGLPDPDLVQGSRPTPGAPAPQGRAPRCQRQGRTTGRLRLRTADRPPGLHRRRRARRRHSRNRDCLSGDPRPALAHLPQVRPGSLESRARPPRMAGHGLARARKAARLARGPGGPARARQRGGPVAAGEAPPAPGL